MYTIFLCFSFFFSMFHLIASALLPRSRHRLFKYIHMYNTHSRHAGLKSLPGRSFLGTMALSIHRKTSSRHPGGLDCRSDCSLCGSVPWARRLGVPFPCHYPRRTARPLASRSLRDRISSTRKGEGLSAVGGGADDSVMK